MVKTLGRYSIHLPGNRKTWEHEELFWFNFLGVISRLLHVVKFLRDFFASIAKDPVPDSN